MTGSTGIVLSVAFSPDGQFLASGGSDNTIRIWRIADGSLIKVFTLPTHYGVFSVAFSPNTQFLASASSHGLAVWRLGTLTPNNPPSVPTLISPADNSTLTTSPFQLKLSATDPDMQRLKFKVELLRNGQVVETFDQTKDTSGWDKAFYASGETATLTISQLAPGNYRWRAYAFDGLDWSSVSEIRNFVFAPQIQWTFYEPMGDVVQIPIFRVKATISGLPSTEKLQYRIEISGDPQFRQNVLIFDQSVEPTMWSKDKYEPDESAGFVARYIFPLYTPLYWRARVKRVGESNWSEPSPSQSFQVMRGFSFSMLEQIRVGRTEQIPVTVVNPYNEPIDLILAAEFSLNTDEFSGTAKVIAPGGVVMDEITFGQEKSYLEAFLRDLPAGTHTFTIQLEVRSTRYHNGTNERIIAPLLSFSLEVLGSWAMSFLLERACESVARTVLGNHGFSPIDANKEIDRLKDAAQDEIVDKGTKQAISELEKRGGGKLLKKVAGKLSPFTGIVSAIDDCVEGIKNAFSGGGDMSVVRSWDPNMKAGVIGREGFIQANEPLPYRILFENIPPPPPALPAPAQEVTITDDLDEDIDLSTFTFTSVGFGNHAFSLPVGTKVLSIDFDLRPEGKNLIVQIRGDLVERRMTVTFKGINPETGRLHPDGFLPVNENPPEGEGWVAFKVRLKEDVRSGAQVKNKASIKFDVNEPQLTSEVVVTVDKVAPQSKVTEITGARSLLRKQSLLATDNGRCVDCGVQQQGNIEVHFEASDDVSGVDIVELWVSEQKVNFRGTRQVIIGERKYRLASTLSGSAAPKFSFRGRFGYNYRFYTVARDVAGNKEPEPDDSDARIAIGQPPTLPAGLYMVSVPVESEDADPKQVFLFESNKWARWNPEARNGQGDYVLYDNDPNGFTRFGESEKVPGRGYWVRIPQQTIIQVYGNLPDETKPFAIPLKKGWNQIGNPWLEDLIWDVSAIKVKFNGQTKALKDLTQGEAVAPYAWRWDGNKYSLIYGTGNKLPSWEGAWVYAYSNCELILSPPSQSKGRETRDAGRATRGDGWTMKLTAQVGSEIGEAILGVSQGSRDLQLGCPQSHRKKAAK
ncbi:WD domain-containing protein, G-beta repeat-containing protein [Candidatus Fervidibacteria bacterium JGI MDM2 JNZ-1-D12]